MPIYAHLLYSLSLRNDIFNPHRTWGLRRIQLLPNTARFDPDVLSSALESIQHLSQLPELTLHICEYSHIQFPYRLNFLNGIN